MKQLALLLLILIPFSSFTQNEKRRFVDTENQIKKYRVDSQKYWDKNDSENALKYNDSIKALIIDSYIENHKFINIDSSTYSTSNNRKKPLFLQVTASWCAPCKAEIPALNKIVEKYDDKVDFVLLFWDLKSDLLKFSDEYDKNIVLVPSPEQQNEPTTIEISGFRHITGFPTNYLITSNNKIINYSQGAVIPYNGTNPETGEEIAITQEDADKFNYERLEKEVEELLKKENSK